MKGEWMSEWKNKRMNVCMNDWMHWCMTEWKLNEWMSELINEWCNKPGIEIKYEQMKKWIAYWMNY